MRPDLFLVERNVLPQNGVNRAQYVIGERHVVRVPCGRVVKIYNVFEERQNHSTFTPQKLVWRHVVIRDGGAL